MVRLYFVIRAWYLEVADKHYSLGYTLNTIEVNLAIVTATIPALWPLARFWFPTVFESMGINRPYLYPDIEVGYVSSGRRSSQQRAAEGGELGASAAQGNNSSPALQGKILWLQRPRPPSFLRSVPDSGGGGGDSSLALTDIRGQRVYGARSTHSAGGSGDEDDCQLDDYHGMIRRAEKTLVHEEEDDFSTVHKPLGSEATGSSTDIRS